MGRILNKKAQSGTDVFFGVITIFGLGLFCLITVFVYGAFMDAASSSEVFNNTPQAMDAMNAVEENNGMWDSVILFIFIGFFLAVMVLGYFIDVHSVFLPIYIMVLLIGVVVSGVLSYVWEQISDTSTFTLVASNSFPITNHILSNLMTYFIILGVLSMIVTYAKTRE